MLTGALLSDQQHVQHSGVPDMTVSTLARFAAGASLALASAMPTHASTTTFFASMSGPAEFVPNTSTATGTAYVNFDDVLDTVAVSETWSGLSGNATVNHIHVATAPGGAGPVKLGFSTFANPSPATGSFNDSFTLNLTDFNSLFNSTVAGLAYVNLHSTAYGGGEIRGFLTPVPEASTYAMMAAGLAALGFVARRRRQA